MMRTDKIKEIRRKVITFFSNFYSDQILKTFPA